MDHRLTIFVYWREADDHVVQCNGFQAEPNHRRLCNVHIIICIACLGVWNNFLMQKKNATEAPSTHAVEHTDADQKCYGELRERVGGMRASKRGKQESKNRAQGSMCERHRWSEPPPLKGDLLPLEDYGRLQELVCRELEVWLCLHVLCEICYAETNLECQATKIHACWLVSWVIYVSTWHDYHTVLTFLYSYYGLQSHESQQQNVFFPALCIVITTPHCSP